MAAAATEQRGWQPGLLFLLLDWICAKLDSIKVGPAPEPLEAGNVSMEVTALMLEWTCQHKSLVQTGHGPNFHESPSPFGRPKVAVMGLWYNFVNFETL